MGKAHWKPDATEERLDSGPLADQAGGEYFAIKLQTLGEDTLVDFNLWLKQGQRVVLYREHDLPFNLEVIDRLRAHNVKELLVSWADREKFCRYVESNLSNILDDRSVAENEKAATIGLAAANLAQDLIAAPDEAKVVRARELCLLMSTYGRDNMRSLAGVVRLNANSGKISAHCVNMAIYSLALAGQLGVGSLSDLADFTLSAYVADLGKQYVPPEILENSEPLDQHGLALVRRHPVQTVEMIGGFLERDSKVAEAILAHHERVDGSGYPRARSGTEIGTMAQVAGIADVFDGLTADRPDRPRRKPYEALQIMTSEMQTGFEDRILKAFVRCLGKLPVVMVRDSTSNHP